LEAVVRRLNVKQGDWEARAGWTAADKARYVKDDPDHPGKTVPITNQYSTCDVLRYRRPEPVPWDRLSEYPVASPANDGELWQAIARLELARRDPGRQLELFGWTTSNPPTRAALEAFENAK